MRSCNNHTYTLVLGDIVILHIDYCELNIADISIYWVVGWIGIQ